MNETINATTPLDPPAMPRSASQAADWLALPAGDAVAQYLALSLWDRPEKPRRWQAARLSSAAFVYREASTGWAVVAKFFSAKTGADAPRHAAREFDLIRKAQAAGLAHDPARAIRPLGLWRGVLFLEYVPGLTLDDVIATRRSQPGLLAPALTGAAALLATLHANGVQPEEPPNFAREVSYAHKLVDNLAKYGVLQDEPLIVEGLRHVIDRWGDNPAMSDYVPALTHGDATTTNFVFPPGSGVVGIDWERAKVIDPAADLGRLVAEVAHSVTRHGGTAAEAQMLVGNICDAYCAALPGPSDVDVLAGRVRFYRAVSTLRIARNGWLSRLERTALVAQALALLA